MTTRFGTAHFVSLRKAQDYYASQGYDLSPTKLYWEIKRKIAAGEIHIGPPPLNPGDRLSTIDDGARYAIER